MPLTESQQRFVNGAIRRKALFRTLCFVGVAAAALLALLSAWRRLEDPGFELGLPAVVVILVLLNARQNLRQYKYAKALEALTQ